MNNDFIDKGILSLEVKFMFGIIRNNSDKNKNSSDIRLNEVSLLIHPDTLDII